MNFLGRFIRTALTIIFIFGMLHTVLLQDASLVEASPGWMKYPGNLALDSKYVLDSCVIKEDDTHYKMWYTRLSFDVSVTQLFTDMKGLELADILTALQNDQFDSLLANLSDLNSLSSPTALWTILNGTRTVIGYAESTDGKNWTIVNANVLPGTGGDFFTSVFSPSVVRIDSTHYKMWYTSLQSTLNSTTLPPILTDMSSATPATRRTGFDNLLNSTEAVIKYATSPEGVVWTPVSTALN
ncbi:MAG: hypothetical protein PHY28_06595, partial [Dehalococcoidales bacterium]|nr:hypothetical protein [Dehalococcoidales bacterium]